MQLALQFLSIVLLTIFEQSLDFTLNVVLSRGDSYRLGILLLGVWIQTVAGHLPSQGAGWGSAKTRSMACLSL